MFVSLQAAFDWNRGMVWSSIVLGKKRLVIIGSNLVSKGYQMTIIAPTEQGLSETTCCR